ncbi:hypothetical protein [Pseudoalteromonas luteoviolacea]|uniref:Uncharacterized protein n=1 Tax=Pseudoalteromonas luteoviolacea NCIMB 1942 TaxID=1365253 RepID=A0A161YAW9_9GAMM|nr:hypothetical protein [Pseudoalteromonas luteoviolacea]KZN54988.1 hypothetical protein N482_05380 [Pseudoalteromonas luteoviolacea NCIMB 1942]
MRTVLYGVCANTEAYLNSPYHTGQIILASTNGGERLGEVVSIDINLLSKIPKHEISSVVICSECLSEIIPSLTRIGFEIKDLYFYNHAQNYLTPCVDMQIPTAKVSNTLFAFYDLSQNLACYDVLYFCALANLERIKRNLQHVHFIIVPNKSLSHEEPGFHVFHECDDFTWRVEKILQGVMTCVTNNTGCTVLPYKESAQYYSDAPHTYPADFIPGCSRNRASSEALNSLSESHDLTYLKAPKTAHDIVQSLLKQKANNKKVVSLTLREYSNHEQRNSNVSEWMKFAQYLLDNDYFPIIIRDSYKAHLEYTCDFDQFAFMPLASLDFKVRQALYEQAFINMSISNGPTVAYNFTANCPAITFMKVDDDIPAIATSTFEKAGVEIGKDLKFRASNLQKLIWKEDTFEHLKKSFLDLVSQI